MPSTVVRLLQAMIAIAAWELALPCSGAGKTLSSTPNVLILHTDEHDFRSLGCYQALLPKQEAFVWGADVAVDTPHLDSIARGGAICDRFYAASPGCTPSRASFVTGRYPQNTGADSNDKPMRDDVVTFAEALRRQGYATGYAGKWHLDGPAKPGWSPARKFGFDDNRYMFNRGHWKQLEDSADGLHVHGGDTYNVRGADARSFTTDFLADKTVGFIRAHARQPLSLGPRARGSATWRQRVTPQKPAVRSGEPAAVTTTPDLTYTEHPASQPGGRATRGRQPSNSALAVLIQNDRGASNELL